MTIKALAACSVLMLNLASSNIAYAADDSISYAFVLAQKKRLCSQVQDAILLQKPSHSLHPSSEICSFRNSIVKTQNGLRLLLAYSFTDNKALPESHGMYWVDVDCRELLYRQSDGYYHSISKRWTPPYLGANVFRLDNGWNVIQYKKTRGEWESLKTGPTDGALIKACGLLSGNAS
jgi:hypothetical protein